MFTISILFAIRIFSPLLIQISNLFQSILLHTLKRLYSYFNSNRVAIEENKILETGESFFLIQKLTTRGVACIPTVSISYHTLRVAIISIRSIVPGRGKVGVRDYEVTARSAGNRMEVSTSSAPATPSDHPENVHTHNRPIGEYFIPGIFPSNFARHSILHPSDAPKNTGQNV